MTTGRPALWITRKLSDATLARAARDYETIVNEADGLNTDDDIVQMSSKVDAIIPCHSEVFSSAVVERDERPREGDCQSLCWGRPL